MGTLPAAITSETTHPSTCVTQCVSPNKVDQPVAGKNPAREELFFSSSAEAPIQPLTLLGVKKAFPDNHRFHDLLDAQFQNGNLTAFDEMHHMTKINWLLRQSRAVAATH